MSKLSEFSIDINAKLDNSFTQSVDKVVEQINRLKKEADKVADSTSKAFSGAGKSTAKDNSSPFSDWKPETKTGRYDPFNISSQEAESYANAVNKALARQDALNASAGRLGEKLHNAAAKMNGLAANILSISGALAAIKIGDNFQSITNRLHAVADDAESIKKARDELFSIANSTGQSVDELSGMFLALHTSQSLTGKSAEEYNKILKTIAQQLALTGTGGQQAASFLLQMRQALTSGTMQAQDFNSLMDASAPIMQKLAKYYGVSAGELKKLASEGKITSKSLTDAWLSMADSTEQAFNNGYVLTFSQSLQVLKNRIVEVLGANMQGITNGVAQSVQWIADNIQTVITASKVLLGAWFAGKAIAATVGLISILKEVKSLIADITILTTAGKFSSFFSAISAGFGALKTGAADFAGSLNQSVAAAGKLNTAIAALGSFEIGYQIGTQIYNAFDTQIQGLLDKLFGAADDLKGYEWTPEKAANAARVGQERRKQRITNGEDVAPPQQLPLEDATKEIEQLTEKTRELSMQLQVGTNADLTAWRYGIQGASAEQQVQIAALKNLTKEYENQLSVMQTLDSLQKQYEQAGMTSQQKQLDDLKRQGATAEQLEKASKLLSGIADKEKAAAEAQNLAAEKLNTASDKLLTVDKKDVTRGAGFMSTEIQEDNQYDANGLLKSAKETGDKLVDAVKNGINDKLEINGIEKLSRGTQLEYESMLSSYFSMLKKQFQNPEQANSGSQLSPTKVIRVDFTGFAKSLSLKVLLENGQNEKTLEQFFEKFLVEAAGV